MGALKNYGIAGRVRAIGTPAEEGGGGKIKLIDAGAYEDVEACLMAHPSKQKEGKRHKTITANTL